MTHTDAPRAFSEFDGLPCLRGFPFHSLNASRGIRNAIPICLTPLIWPNRQARRMVSTLVPLSSAASLTVMYFPNATSILYTDLYIVTCAL